MKKNKNELARIEELIKADRLSFKDDFSELLCSDIDRVLRDYFDYKGLPLINIDKNGSAFLVRISLNANLIRSFSSLPKEEANY